MEWFVPNKVPVAVVECVSEPLQQRGRRTCSEHLSELQESLNPGFQTMRTSQISFSNVCKKFCV